MKKEKTLEVLINDLRKNMFGGKVDLIITYNGNCKLYYCNQFDRIPKSFMEKKVIQKDLMGDTLFVRII